MADSNDDTHDLFSKMNYTIFLSKKKFEKDDTHDLFSKMYNTIFLSKKFNRPMICCLYRLGMYMYITC